MKALWWHWTVSIVAVIYSASSVYDYIFLKTGHPGYTAAYGQDMMDWLGAFPLWREALWFLGIALPALGALLLLLRKRQAAPVFLLALVCLLIGFVVHDLAMANGAQIYGTAGLIAGIAIIAVTALLWIYSGFATKRKILT